MSGLVFYALLVVNLLQFAATRDGIYITGAWVCVILAALARLERKIADKSGQR